MGEFAVGIDNPESADVRALLDRHLAFSREHSIGPRPDVLG
jgi:hypothetical protein